MTESPKPRECVAPPPLQEALSAEGYAAVRAISAPADRSLAELLDNWRIELELFWRQMDLPAAQWTDRTWHRHDWMGALHARAVITQSLQSFSVPPDCLRWLDQVDAFMHCFTVEPDEPWNDEPRPAGAWWWQRLPIRGPVTSGWWADR